MQVLDFNNTENKEKQKKKAKDIYRYKVYYFPGKYMTESEKKEFVEELRETAATCFEEIPEYQAMQSKGSLDDKVIAVAWRKDGKMGGFCSTIILNVEGVGAVQHLGLTCVRPEDRSNGLTHILTHKAVAYYLMRHKPIIGKHWVSNCAAVLSSLVNVSLHFENVYPSPYPIKMTHEYKKIAEAIDKYYREEIYINKDAKFDPDNFVFRGSVKGTVFQKSEKDTNFYHRNRFYNDYYKDRMEFENGDEVLQVGYASTVAAIKHSFRNLPLPKPKPKTEIQKQKAS